MELVLNLVYLFVFSLDVIVILLLFLDLVVEARRKAANVIQVYVKCLRKIKFTIMPDSLHIETIPHTIGDERVNDSSKKE